MHRKRLFIFLLSFLTIAAVTGTVLAFQNGDEALDMVGQLDAEGNPDYLKSIRNNAPRPSGVNGPTQAVIDEVGHRLFVSDFGNNRVLVFALTNDNQLTDYSADFVLGQPDLVHSNSGTTSTTLSSPIGLAFDAVHNHLYVADSGNHRVMDFDVASITNGEAAVHVLGQPNFTSAGASTTQAGMSTPTYAHYDASTEYLYVSDSGNHRVLIFDLADVTNGEVAVDGLGQVGDDGVSVAFTRGTSNHSPGSSGMGYVQATTLDEVHHRLFVADRGNSRVLMFQLDEENQPLDYIADAVLGQPDMVSNGAGSGLGQFYGLNGIAYDPNHNYLYAADYSNARVLVFDVAAITNGEEAVYYLGRGGSAQSTLIGSIGVSYDAVHDRLFVADPGSQRVLIFDTATVETNEDALAELGQEDFDAGPTGTTASTFSSPTEVAYDGVHNRLFVSDQDNNRVMVFDATNFTNGEDAVHVLGQVDFTSSSAGCSENKITANGALAYDPTHDRLFVSDLLNHRVLVFDTVAISDGEDAVHVLGQANFDDGSSGVTASTFNLPSGLTYDVSADQLFVGDKNNFRVLSFDVAVVVDGEVAVNGVGQTNGTLTAPDFTVNRVNNGPLADSLALPKQLVVSPTLHRLFVSDSGNNRVVVYDLDVNNYLVDRIADHVLGQEVLNTSLNEIGPDDVTNPMGLALSEDETQLFLVDREHQRVLQFDVTVLTDGEDATHVIGQDSFFTTTAGTAPAKLYYPEGLTYETTNKHLYVGDFANHRVAIFPVENTVDAEDAINVVGQTNASITSPVFTTSSQNNGAFADGLNRPYDSVVDSNKHRLFVSDDINHRVLVYNLDEENYLLDHTADYVLGQEDFHASYEGLSSTRMNRPQGLAFDEAGERLFVSDIFNNRVLVFSVAELTSGQAAQNVLGQPSFATNDGGTDQRTLSSPSSLAFDPNHNQLFVSDLNNNRVLVFDTTRIVNGEDAVYVLGQANFTSSGSATSQTRMHGPTGVAYDAVRDRLFVAEYNNTRILQFDASSIVNGEAAVHILGHEDFVTSEGGRSETTMAGLYDLSYDAIHDRLFVADGANARVMVFSTASITDGEAAVNVLGATNFIDNLGGTTRSTLGYPEGVTYDPFNDTLWVTEYYNNRLMQFDVTPAGITVTPTDASTRVAEGGATDTYTVVLDAEPSQSVLFSLTPDAQTTVSPTTLTFSTDNWATPQTVTVTAVNDATVEGEHASTITQTVGSDDSEYDGLSVASMSVTVTDNDAPVTGGSGGGSGGGGGGGSSAPSSPTPSKPTVTKPSDSNPVVSKPVPSVPTTSTPNPSSSPSSSNPSTPTASTKPAPVNAPVVGEPKKPVATEPALSRFLSVGSRGEDVRTLQKKLARLGYFTYPTFTTYFGSVTEAAVRAFQRANKIDTRGYVGPATRGALNKL